jgi:hypothetical protein
MADIEGVSIDLKDPQNLFGQIISAELTISGNLMDLTDMLENWTLYPYDYLGKKLRARVVSRKALRFIHHGDCALTACGEH